MIPVAMVLQLESLDREADDIDEAVTRLDDGYWLRFVEAPFSWRRFLQWWVARRWVEPRDIRKR